MNESRRFDLFAVTVAVWSIVLQGHRFGVGNNEIFVAFVRKINDPQWLANDWIMNTAVPHPITTHALALLCRAMPESWAFLLAQLATRCLLYMGAWRLLRAIMPQSGLTAFALVALAIFQEPHAIKIGSHFLHAATWESAHLGMAATVWFLAYALRWFRAEDSGVRGALFAGIAGGLACLAHLFIALPVCAVAGIAALILRRSAASIGAFTAAAALIAAPALVPAALGFFEHVPNALSASDTIALLQWRHPHHHAPWTWVAASSSSFVREGLLLAVLAASWFLLPIERQPRTLFRVLLAWFAVTTIAFTWFGFRREIPALAFFQPFRLFPLLWLYFIAAALSKKSSRDSYGIAAAAILLLPMRVMPGVTAALLLVWARRPITGEFEFAGNVLASFRRLPLWLFAIGGAAAMLTLQTVTSVRDSANRVRTHWLVDTEPRDRERSELRDLLRREFPPDAVFVIPESLAGFRIVEERAVFLEPKNFPHRAADLAEYVERLKAYDGSPAPKFKEVRDNVILRGPEPLSHLLACARTLRDRYGVDGIVIDMDSGFAVKSDLENEESRSGVRLIPGPADARYMVLEILQEP